jgi:outer membrane receptor protein involved in Fe transport
VPEAVRGTIEETVRSQLTAAGQRLAAAGLTRLQNGRTAIVVSYTNAGRATEQGIEIGARVPMGLDWTLHASYTYLDFEIDASSLVAGDVFEPNTPRHKGSIGVSYRQGPLDAGATLRIAEAYDWAAGVFMGPVPARQVVDVRATWHLNANLAFQAVATNLFNQRQYELFGGSVVGRRVLIGLTTAW